jgi:uncharacterized protein (DUF1778 family)
MNGTQNTAYFAASRFARHHLSSGGEHMGRGPGSKPDTDKRNRRIVVRVTDDEADLIKRTAEVAGLSQSDLVRRAVLCLKIQAPVPEVNRQLYIELARAQGNLHQLSKAINFGKVPDNTTTPVEEVRKLVMEVRKELMGRGK